MWINSLPSTIIIMFSSLKICTVSHNYNQSPGFLVAQSVKNLPAVQETQIQSLGGEDSPEKGMATHSTIPARRIPRREELGRL